MKAKRFLALMLAVLMMATLCIPAAAAALDVPCCSDPWLENPEYVAEYSAYDEDCHEVTYYAYYECSHCGGTYVEEETSFESHSFAEMGDYEECTDCGYKFYP